LAVRVALDTNRYVDLCKGVDETVSLLEEAEAILVPFVVLGELRAGFGHGRRQADNERTLRQFLLKEGVHVLFADDPPSSREKRGSPTRRRQAVGETPSFAGRLCADAATVVATRRTTASMSGKA
jgi:predicted nucleic acid-binding protein